MRDPTFADLFISEETAVARGYRNRYGGLSDALPIGTYPFQGVAMIDPIPVPNGAPRLRDHPITRGIGNNQILHLADAVDHLVNEVHPAIHGHRQITLFRQAPVTLVLFVFDAGGELPDHVAQGIVSIQVLNGRLSIQIAGNDHRLDAGQILFLNPAIAHSVRAEIASTMLLTVHHMESITMAQTTVES